ncbi:shikimate kinase [Aliikangiella sp. IMCC44632]
MSETRGLAHLDLDGLAWKPSTPPERKPIDESWKEIDDFISANNNWVIEGCYTDLLDLVKNRATEIIFMNLSVEACQLNARARPWEPHKYPSKQAQDDNLEMLVDWIGQYDDRTDTFSYSAHLDFYESYSGKKKMITQNKNHTSPSLPPNSSISYGCKD